VGVEDARDMAEAIRLTLTSEAFDVRLAHDGHTGLELARSAAPDVVLLDIDLPDIDSWEVCRHVRTFSDAYVVMVTVHADEFDRVPGLSSGADDYIHQAVRAPRARGPHPGDAPSPAEARWIARAADVGHRRERRAPDVGQGPARFVEQRLGVGERVAVLAVGTTSALCAAAQYTVTTVGRAPLARTRRRARASVSRPHGEPLKPMVRSRCKE